MKTLLFMALSALIVSNCWWYQNSQKVVVRIFAPEAPYPYIHQPESWKELLGKGWTGECLFYEHETHVLRPNYDNEHCQEEFMSHVPRKEK